MALHASDQHVFDLLKDKIFAIPLNQRKYVWNKTNWEELFDDLEIVVSEANKSHFIGSIVLKSEKSTNGVREHFSIIDGQQRIITLSCLLLSIGIFYFLNNEKGKAEAIARHLIAKDNASNSFAIVSPSANESVARLAVRFIDFEHPFASYSAFFNSVSVDKGIKECLDYFYGRVEGKDMLFVDKMLSAIDDIRYVHIKAENDEDAYSIFEVLNARGQPLSNFDLLRNYILKYVNASQRKNASKRISEIEASLGKESEIFVRHYSIHKYQNSISSKDSSPYKRIVVNEKGKSKDSLLDDLIIKASLYKKIISFEGCSPLELKIFKFFKARRQQQFRPLILGLMHQHYYKKTISIEKYEECLEKLFRFFVCYNVVGEQTSNKINDIVEGYSYKIENAYSESVLSDLYKSLSERIPDKQVFTTNISNIRYSSHFKAYSGSKKEDNVKAVLEILEIINGSNLKFYDLDFNIEHCYSDSDSEENSMIGNLILLETDLNNALGHKPLSDKVKVYQDSIFALPKLVSSNFEKNGNIDIEKRNLAIADKLYEYIKNLT